MKRLVIALLFVVAGSIDANAQPADPNPGGTPTPIPGAVWLAVAGAAVGVKALKGKKEVD